MAAPIGPVRLYRSKYGSQSAPVAPPSTSPAPVRYYKPKYVAPVAPRIQLPPPVVETPEQALSSRSWRETAVDTGIRAARQAGGLVQSGLALFGPEDPNALAEVPDYGVGIGGLVARTGQVANAAIGSGLDALGEYTSPGRMRADELFAQIDAEEKAALPSIEASAPVPASSGRFGPHQGVGYDPAAVARSAQRAEQEAKLTFRKIGADPAGMVGDIAGNALPFMAAGRLGRAAGIAEEVMAPAFSVPLEAGSVKQNIAQTVMGEPHENLMSDPRYAAEVEVFGKEVARKRLADRAQSYLENPGLIALGAAEGYILSKAGADAALMRAGSGAVKEGITRGVLKNTLREGAKEFATELPQEMFTTAAGNIGAASGGANIDPMKGVVESGIMAGFTAGPAGAAAGAADAFKSARAGAENAGQASAPAGAPLADDEFTQTAVPDGQEPLRRGAEPVQSRGDEPFGAPIAPARRPGPAFDPTSAQIVLEAEILGGDGLKALMDTGMSKARAESELKRVRAVLGPKAPAAKGVDRAEDKKAERRRAEAEAAGRPSPADEIASFDADPLANAPRRREATPEEVAAYLEDAQRGIMTAEEEAAQTARLRAERDRRGNEVVDETYAPLLEANREARTAAERAFDDQTMRPAMEEARAARGAREEIASRGGPAFRLPPLMAAAVAADSIKPLVDAGVPGSPSQLRKMLEKAKASESVNVASGNNLSPAVNLNDIAPMERAPVEERRIEGIGIANDRGQLGEVGQKAQGIAERVNPVGRAEETLPAVEAGPQVERPARVVAEDSGESGEVHKGSPIVRRGAFGASDLSSSSSADSSKGSSQTLASGGLEGPTYRGDARDGSVGTSTRSQEALNSPRGASETSDRRTRTAGAESSPASNTNSRKSARSSLDEPALPGDASDDALASTRRDAQDSTFVGEAAPAKASEEDSGNRRENKSASGVSLEQVSTLVAEYRSEIESRVREIQRKEPNLPRRVIAQRINDEFSTDNRLGRGREALGRRIVDEILKGQENPKTTDRGNYPGGPVSAMLNSRKDTGIENDPERALYEAMDRQDRQQQHIAESVAAKVQKDAANLAEQEALRQRLEESVRNTRREGVQGEPAVGGTDNGARGEGVRAPLGAQNGERSTGDTLTRPTVNPVEESPRNELVANEAPHQAHAESVPPKADEEKSAEDEKTAQRRELARLRESMAKTRADLASAKASTRTDPAWKRYIGRIETVLNTQDLAEAQLAFGLPEEEDFLASRSTRLRPKPEPPATAPVKTGGRPNVKADRAPLPQKAIDMMESALAKADIKALREMLHPMNPTWRSMFTERTGVKLPKGVRATWELLGTPETLAAIQAAAGPKSEAEQKKKGKKPKFSRPGNTEEMVWENYNGRSDSGRGETTLEAYKNGIQVNGAAPGIRVVDFEGDVEKSVLGEMARASAALAARIAPAVRMIQAHVPMLKFGGFAPAGNLHGVQVSGMVFVNQLATHQIAVTAAEEQGITYHEAFARAMTDVLIHEAAHYAERGHGDAFLAELERIREALGPVALRAIRRDLMKYASDNKNRTQNARMYEKALPGWREGERRGREAAAAVQRGDVRGRPDVPERLYPRPRSDTGDAEGAGVEGDGSQGSLFAPDFDQTEGMAAPAFVRGTDGRVAFSRKPPAPPEKLSIAAEGVLNDLAKRIRDVFTPVKVAQETVEKKLGKRWDVRLDRQLTGIPARADHTMGQAESLFLNPLMEIVRTKGLDFDLAGEYAQARYDAGMDEKKRAAILAKAKNPAYEEVRKRILDVQRISDDYKVKMGLATAGDIADLRDIRGADYVSTKEHPLLAAIQDLEKTVIQAERNRTLNDMAEFVEAAGEPALGSVSEGFEDGGVHFRRDGEPMTINLPDKGLREAMDGLSDTQLDNLTQTVGALTRWTSRVNTQLSPVFPIRNTGRDWGGAILFGSILHGAPKGISKSVAWEVMKNEARAMRGVIDYLKAPEKKHPDGSWAAKVAEASRYGAVPGYLKQMSSIGKIRSQLEEALKSKLPVREHLKVNAAEARATLGDKSLDSLGKAAKIASLGTDAASRAIGFRAFSDFMGWLSNVSEMATRANYHAALVKNGMSPRAAADETRDLIDFNRKGSWTRNMQAFLPFINPNIQGTARILDMVASKDPAVKGRAVKTITALTAAGFAYGMAMAALGGDEDKDGIPDMDQLPDFQSSRNVALPAVGNLAPILLPLPPGFNVPFFAGFMASKIARGTIKPGKAIASIATQFAEAFTPIDSPFGVFKPIGEIAVNKKFGGGPVSPTNFSEHRPDSTVAFKNTRTPYRAAAEGLNRLTGGDEVTKGLIDVSPDTLEHLGEALLGGTGRFFTRSADSIEALAKGQVPNYIPVYSDLTVDVERQRQARFYDQVRQIEETDFKRRGKEKSALVQELAARYPGVDFTRGTLPQLRKALQGQGVSPERREWFLKELERIDADALKAKPAFDAAEKALKEIEKTMKDGPEKDAARREVYLRANRAYQEATK